MKTLTKLSAVLALVMGVLGGTGAQAAPTMVDITGEIQSLSLTSPGDHWSGGTIVVGGQTVILPRNLLLDLPANRLTLKQLFDQAPAACVSAGQSGIARGDSCNKSGAGGIAHLTANRTNGGNVIAGDAFLEKGAETLKGIVTYINYTQGWVALNGALGDGTTGVMVRLNDPSARHTVQQGPGCESGSSNCSADPRFALDPDNYTNVFMTGYPLCIPSTIQRVFPGLPASSVVSSPVPLAGALTSADAAGNGDALCPTTNRTVNGGSPVDDSRRMAPVMLGDSITAEGNFEKINGVYFLSAHTTHIGKTLVTKNGAVGQPDYILPDEVEQDAPGYQNRRIKSLIIGFASVQPADVVVWGIHYDPVTNERHEFPWASTLGCNNAAGAGTCTAQGIDAGAPWDIFKIRYDADFLGGIKPRFNPCAHLRADPRLAALDICRVGGSGGNNLDEMMGILSPMPREVMFRTGIKLADMARTGGPILKTIDVSGNEATNGQYLFPFGVGLGGVGFPEFVEIDLNAVSTANNFTGLPWTLDRRLSPGGCNGPCETTPQPLDPYPFEGIGMDPRLQAPATGLFGGLPTGPYSDPAYQSGTLSSVRDRILSYVNPTAARAGNGAGVNATGNFGPVLNWPPVDPAPRLINPTPEVNLIVTQAGGTNQPPVAVNDSVQTAFNAAITINVLGNDTDPDNNSLVVTSAGPSAQGTVATDGVMVIFTPTLNFSGLATFSYTINDGNGGSSQAIVAVTVNPTSNFAPVANPDLASVAAGSPVVVNVLANDTDANADVLSVTGVGPATRGTVTRVGNIVTYTANPGPAGTDSFTYSITDGHGGNATSTVNVNITAVENLAVGSALFRTARIEWRISGTSSSEGATVTVRLGSNGPIIGTAVVTLGVWTIAQRGSSVIGTAGSTISTTSTGGGVTNGFIITVRN